MKWRFRVSSLSEELRLLSLELLKISQSTKRDDDKDHETVYSYYYSKGALDFRDKLLALMGGLPPLYSALEAYYVLLDTYPDDYPGPAK
jgi:hypothetical protein